MKRSGAVLAVMGFSFCICWLTQQANAVQFDQIVVFGDSLSETGNAFQSSQGAFPPSMPPGLYDNGRLSNGPVWVEYLADAIGAPLPTPSLLGGTNFAWAGAQSVVSFETYDSTLDPDPFPLSSTVSVREQVGSFLSDVALGGVAPNPDTTLYIVWGAANDFLIGDEQASTVAAKNIESSIQDLIHSAGAAHLLVPNMPPLVDTPGVGGGFDSVFVAEDQPSKLNKRVDKFNTKLSKRLDKIKTKNSDVNIYDFDVFSLYQQVLSDPEGNGFNPNTDIPVLNEAVLYGTQPGALYLNDPGSSLFWDGVHPTTLAHSVLAKEAAKLLDPTTSLFAPPMTISAVPEPSTFVPLLLGSLAFLLCRRAGR